MESSREHISQTGVVENRDDAPQSDSNLPTKPGSGGGADVDSSANLLRELELLSDTSAAVSPPTNPSDNPPSDMRSERMSSVSEQEHHNPRDPLYYAPPWLRERSASQRDGSSAVPFSPASFDTQLESAVSNALRHPLDPEVMHEPEVESKKALWKVAARFGAAIGVAALVALFFVVAVPGSRQSEGEPTTLAGFAQSIKSALAQSGETSQKPAISEFQALLASTPPSAPASTEQSGQLLQQFMQWREKPDPAAPQRNNP
jgi:hypothetical protein